MYRTVVLGLRLTRGAHSIATTASHAGFPNDIIARGLSPPIHLATTFERDEHGNYPPDSFIYGRDGNPTRNLLEKVFVRSCVLVRPHHLIADPG